MLNGKLKIISSIVILTVITIVICSLGSNSVLHGSLKTSNLNLTEQIGHIGLGDYIFLMSPSPNEDEDGTAEELKEFGSYLVITDQNYQIIKSIKVDGNFDQIVLNDNYDIILYNSSSADKVISTFSQNGYSSFEEYQGKVPYEELTYIELAPNEITLINDNQVVILEDPTFIESNHDFFIVDFVQYSKY